MTDAEYIAALKACLKQCVEELRGWIDSHYEPYLMEYPHNRRRRDADLATVREAEKLLEEKIGE